MSFAFDFNFVVFEFFVLFCFYFCIYVKKEEMMIDKFADNRTQRQLVKKQKKNFFFSVLSSVDAILRHEYIIKWHQTPQWSLVGVI